MVIFLRSSWSRRILIAMVMLGLALMMEGGRQAAFAAQSVPTRGASGQQIRSSADAAVSTWHILLLIFRQTDTDYVDSSGVTRHLQATLPQSDADALVAAFGESLPAAVAQWSDNQAAWDVQVEYPSQPITRVASLGGATQWVDPSCISQAMQEYFRPGYHDVVMVYWRSSDDAGSSIPSPGWGLATLESNPAYGYLTVTWPGWTAWNASVADMWTQVWIHEWLHTVCDFYGGLGYQIPAGGPDGAQTHGYIAEQPPYPGWGTYYADMMNDRVLENGVMTGIPAGAWARATIRDANDVVAPTTTQTGADAAWHNQPVTITLAATDSGSPVSGVYSTEYSIDDGPWTAGTSLTLPAPADHSGDGVYTVSYRSCDAVGNCEIAKYVTVKIDTIPPVVTASGVSDGTWLNHAATVTLNATDNAGSSGVASISYTLDGVTHTVAGTRAQVQLPLSPNGVHTLSYQASDVAGNESATHNLGVHVEIIPMLAAFTPTSGLVGSSVTLTGTNFTNATAVSFNGHAASFTVRSATQIITHVPSGATSGAITVTTSGGVATSTGRFTVIMKPTLTLKLSGPSRGIMKLGKALTASGKVTPTNLGGKLALTVDYKLGTKWVKAASWLRSLSTSGTYGGTYKPGKRGSYRIQATIAKTSTHTAATTAWLAVTVK